MMQKKSYIFTCPGICWIVGAAFGVLLAILLGLGMLAGLFCAVVVSVGAALFLQWALCHVQGQTPVSEAMPASNPTSVGQPAAQSTGFIADTVKADLSAGSEVVSPPPVSLVSAAVTVPEVQNVQKPAAFKTKSAAAEKSVVKAETPKKSAEKIKSQTSVKKTKPAAKVAPVGGTVAVDGKPEMLLVARDGKADNLKEIKGVGPKLEALLNRMGVFHFDQIASWRVAEVAWVDQNTEGFKGRVSRDAWVDQAKILAAGEDTAFSKRVDKGEIY